MNVSCKQQPILIAGAGVAGLSAALHLLRRGYAVVVADKARQVPDKVCGEGILPFGVEQLQALGLMEAVLGTGRSFHGIVYECQVGDNLKQVTGRFPDGSFGIGVDRGCLHRLLRSRCEAMPGFTYQAGRAVTLEDFNEHAVTMAADGVHSSLGRAVGRELVQSDRLGLRFRLDVPTDKMVRVRFLRHAEIYLTPVAERQLSVAMLVDKRQAEIAGGDLKAWSLEQFQQAFPAYRSATVRDLKARGPIATHVRGRTPGFHLMGDALRAFDPISGAGMSFALVCAAKAVENLDDTRAYYRAMQPVMRSVGGFTRTVLFFRGGGLRTRLMLRQLSRAPRTFAQILAMHDGHHQFTDLSWRDALALLRV